MEDPLELLDTDAALAPLWEAIQDNTNKQNNNVSTLHAMVSKVLGDADIFCGFDTIHDWIHENVKEKNKLLTSLLATLELFSYGTYQDYIQEKDQFIPLNDTQLFKLRQLTVLSCVQHACCHPPSTSNSTATAISYDTLEQALQLPSTTINNNNNNTTTTSTKTTVEQVLISCLYARVLNGTLCQKTRQLLVPHVPPCRARDVPLATTARYWKNKTNPSEEELSSQLLLSMSLEEMMERFLQLEQRLVQAQDALVDAQGNVQSQLQHSEAYWKQVQDRQTKAQALVSSGNIATTGSGGGGMRGLGGGGSGGWSESAHGMGRRGSASRVSSNKRSRGGGLSGSFSSSSTTDPFRP